jgi:hypothetical protein
MKRLLALAGAAALLAGCAWAAAPVYGWYTDAKWGTEVPAGPPGSKTGESHCTSILGIVATGDASIEAAAKSGGISRVMTVDHEAVNVLGIYSAFKTKVTGE